MANLQQAPVLKHSGEKQKEKQFYSIPQDIADIVFTELGNSSAQLRIMMVLIGTKEGFAISEKWILERTGLQHSSYINARKALTKRGWITHTDGQIVVNFDNIRGNTTLLHKIEVIPHYPDEVIPHYSIGGNTTLPITNNITNKETNTTEFLANAKNSQKPREEVIIDGEISTEDLSRVLNYEIIGEDLVKFPTGKIYKII